MPFGFSLSDGERIWGGKGVGIFPGRRGEACLALTRSDLVQNGTKSVPSQIRSPEFEGTSPAVTMRYKHIEKRLAKDIARMRQVLTNNEQSRSDLSWRANSRKI